MQQLYPCVGLLKYFKALLKYGPSDKFVDVVLAAILPSHVVKGEVLLFVGGLDNHGVGLGRRDCDACRL